MKFFFVLGLGLFAVAGWAVTAQSTVGRSGLFASAFDLWYALDPNGLVLTEIRIEAVAPWLWDPVLRTVLRAPAWLLAGIPGAALIWCFRPRQAEQPEDRAEGDRLAESAYFYDRLAKSARDEHLAEPEFDGHRYDDLVKAAREEGVREGALGPDSELGNLTDEQARAIIEAEREASRADGPNAPRPEVPRS